MPVLTFPPLRSPTPKPLILPFKQPFSIDPSCVLCLLPMHDDKWYDFSGHDNHGAIHGATWTAKGRIGPALSFDGVDDYVDCGNAKSLDITDAITIEAWVKPNALADRNIVSKEYPVYSYNLALNPSGITLEISPDGSQANRKLCIAPLPAIGQGSHIVAVFKPSTFMRVHINGELGKEETTGIPASIYSTSYPVRIGTLTGSLWFFNGLIDEVRIYNRALSALEIKALYELGAGIRAG